MKGSRFAFVVRTAAFLLLLAGPSADAELLYTVPSLEGTLQDPDTGTRIPGAIVEIQCIRETTPPGRAPGTVLKTLLVPADANGVFRFSRRSFVRAFDTLALTVRQPLQETLTLTWTWKELAAMMDGRNPEGVKRPVQAMAGRWEYRENTMFITVYPQALDVKYRDTPDLRQEGGLLAGELYQAEVYFRQAKKLGLTVDTRQAFALWGRLADRFPSFWPVMREKEKKIEDMLGGREPAP